MKKILTFIFFSTGLSGISLFGQSDYNKSEAKITLEGETGDSNLIIIYGRITEKNCLFNIGDVHIKYGKSNYWFNNTETDPYRSDAQGNYIIEIRAYEEDLGLSFNYHGYQAHADFFVPAKRDWKGKRIKMDIGLKLMFSGLDCF